MHRAPGTRDRSSFFFSERSRFLCVPTRIVRTERVGAMPTIANTQAAYTPEWRRPIAGCFRATADRAVQFCVRHRIHADTVSYLSIAAAAAAGLCFWRAADSPWLLLLAPVFC